MKPKLLGLIAAGLLAGPMSATAVPIDTSPITSAYYFEFNGLLWAWASPVSTEDYFGNTLSAPGIQSGWRMATPAEWALRPDYTAFSGTSCASRFWNSVFTHCDYGDSLTNILSPGATNNSSDLWYVKSASVPEPGIVSLLGLGLLGLGISRRKAEATRLMRQRDPA
jgi:hypothetical protein